MTNATEFRCVECGWLDPRLWTNQERCACSHYWEVQVISTNPRSIQLIFWADGEVGIDEHVRNSTASNL